MTRLATAYATVTVTNTTTPRALLDVEITNTGGPAIDLTVTGAAFVAAAQRFQRVGVTVRSSRPDGVFVTMPDREIGNELVIDESAETFGDRLTLQLVGERFSPFARQYLRSRRPVEVEVVYGSPANEYRTKVFSGFVAEAPFDCQPPNSRVTCLDAAGLYSQRRAPSWMLPPNSMRSRLSIALELLGIGGIPIRSLTLPNGDGGIIKKPRALGDSTILEFLRDFLGAICVEIGFEDGQFVAYMYDASQPSVLELNPGNLCTPVTLTSPLTLEANVTGVVSVAFERTEPGGLRTVETRVVTTGPYAVMTKDGPGPSGVKVISEVVTKTTYFGSLDVHTEQTESGWYAVRGAREQIEPLVDDPGYEVVAFSGTSYEYPDGSTRAEAAEQFRRLRNNVRSKELDSDRYVIATREERYFLHFLRKALFQVQTNPDPPFGIHDVLQTVTAIPLNDEGEGILGDREVMGLLVGDGGVFMEGGLPASSLYLRPDELVETEYVLNADKTIQREIVTEHFYSIGSARRRTLDAYGYGVESRTYASRPAEAFIGASDPWGGLRTTTKNFRAIDEDRYEIVTVIREGDAPTTTRTETLAGALPRAERAEATSTAQEIRAEVEDSLRVAQAGETIKDTEHNEYIETSGEARALAVWRQMLRGAVVLDATTPIEGQVHKFRMVTLNLPHASIDGLKFYVRAVQRNVATKLERIIGHYYPPHVS